MSSTTPYSYQPHDPSRRYRGLAVVAGLHVLLAWALVSGTARKGFEILKKRRHQITALRMSPVKREGEADSTA